MKVPLSWLKQFLPLTQTAAEIALHLSNLGIEVEEITGHEATFSGIVVGKVLAAEKHPNADRLRVATVSDGEQDYQVVCGAPNCRAGITVAFARLNAELMDDDGKKWKIKKSKIRDVESFGMLCSSKELKLSDDSEGIVELPTDTPLGIDIAAIVLDPVFDLSLTPNLGHCQSILGIARELAASLNLKLHPLNISASDEGREQLHVETCSSCPRFSCRIIQGIKVGPSPTWLQNRLLQCGIRPINNVVDAGNYVTLELGHPLHIFDRDQIAGSTIRVQETISPMKFETLDGLPRELPVGAILISDREKPLSIAGIMGGASSAVSDKTQNILIEAASFSRASIRKTSRLLDLKTDASSRFDRGTDQGNILISLNRATQLILEIGGGKSCPIVDHYPEPSKPRVIQLRPSFATHLLGVPLSNGEIIELLKRLDMKVDADFQVTVPSYRNDVTCEIDLVEEVARLYGYNHIPRKNPVYAAGTLADSPLFLLERKFRTLLLQEGLQECITCDLISPEESALTHEKEIPDAATLRVLHPRSQDLSVLRTSLLPGLLKVAQHNFNHGEHNLALFEIGKVHFKEQDSIKEPSCAAILLAGLSREAHFDRKPQDFDFFDLKGMIENLMQTYPVQFTPSHLRTLHPWRQAQVKVGDIILGVFGEIHPQLVLKSNLDGRILFAELNLNDILALKTPPMQFQPLSTYPSSVRDWTVTTSSHLLYNQLCNLIQSSKTEHLESFALIDSFSSEELGDGRKNLTFRFVYRGKLQTISAETVAAEHNKLIQSVAKKLANLV